MGISSTKRGIRTWAATEEYRDNWARIFEKEGPIDLSRVPPSHPTEVVTHNWVRSMIQEYLIEYEQRIQDLEEAVFYAKEKAPTPVKESGPCSHKTCGYEVGGRWSCEYPPI